MSIASPDKTPSWPEHGDHLTRHEFERRWESTPCLRHAELLNGVVYLGGAVPQAFHGRQHAYVSVWLGNYASLTPGLDFGTAASIRLDNDNMPQPDGHLRLPASAGSTARLDDEGYVAGAPDLVAEVSASTASIDLHLKLRLYQRHGVREYIVWRSLDEEIDWFVLEQGEYVRLARDADGWYRSRLFPGLWLQPDTLLHGFRDAIHAMMHEGIKSPAHAAFVQQLAAGANKTQA